MLIKTVSSLPLLDALPSFCQADLAGTFSVRLTITGEAHFCFVFIFKNDNQKDSYLLAIIEVKTVK